MRALFYGGTMSAITTADKIWVIKRGDGDLAYVSQMDSGHKNRKETATGWAEYHRGAESKSSEYEYDNVPTANIEFISSHTRYSTSNKVMQLRDPRGFECQIYIDNLTSIIKNVEISNGIIKTPLKWGRRSGNLYLMIPDEASEAIQIGDRVSLSKIPVGSYYKKGVDLLKYLGRKKFKATYYLWEKQLTRVTTNAFSWRETYRGTICKKDIEGEPLVVSKNITLPISLETSYSEEICATYGSTSIAVEVEEKEDPLKVGDRKLKNLIRDCVDGKLSSMIREELDIPYGHVWEFKEGREITTSWSGYPNTACGYIYKLELEEIE